jgi:FtsH-binding integral membrane protein
LAPPFGAACLLAVLTAAFNASFVTFRINGDVVTGHEFLRTAGPAFFVLGVLALAIAYSIWQERSWTRWLVLSFWAAAVAVNVGLGWANSGARGAVSAIAGLAVLLVFVAWYLFGKQNVVEYFHALERQSAQPDAGVRPSNS